MTPAYRYKLTRAWPSRGLLDPQDVLEHSRAKLACWIMLNPSTADERKDDATIRRVSRFTHDWGYEGLIVVNLYAARATQPSKLALMDDPVGPENNAAIEDAMTRCKCLVICAWGASEPFAKPGYKAGLNWMDPQKTSRRKIVKALADKHDIALHCLGRTRGGDPMHPLYVPANRAAIPFLL